MKIFGKILQNLIKFRDRDKEKIEFHPKRDWLVLVIFFILLSLSLTLFYRSLFVSDYSAPLNEQALTGNSQELSLENISSNRLNSILRKWEEKKGKFENLMISRPSFDFLK